MIEIDPVEGTIIEIGAGEELSTLVDVEARTDAYLRGEYQRLRKIRDARDGIRAKIAELRGAPALPGPRHRTPTQQRVAECPRCSHRESS